ncbi:hypothetical protein K438DRAFT_1783009 [Mycena galopus ATCC 62051]|nr:hypothetical protein K438DRAFT_1783009 [Mycena galopus ATCC 62051]
MSNSLPTAHDKRAHDGPLDSNPSVPHKSSDRVKNLVDSYLTLIQAGTVICTFCAALSGQILGVFTSDGTIEDNAAFVLLRCISYVAMLFNGITALISLLLIHRLGDVGYREEGEPSMNGSTRSRLQTLRQIGGSNLMFVLFQFSFLLQILAYIWLREGLVMSVIFSILFALTVGAFGWTYCVDRLDVQYSPHTTTFNEYACNCTSPDLFPNGNTQEYAYDTT